MSDDCAIFPSPHDPTVIQVGPVRHVGQCCQLSADWTPKLEIDSGGCRAWFLTWLGRLRAT